MERRIRSGIVGLEHKGQTEGHYAHREETILSGGAENLLKGWNIF